MPFSYLNVIYILFFTKNILLMMKGVDTMNYDNLIPLDKLTLTKKENRKLISTVLVPSASHSYALAVEYVRQWFLSKFDKDYFKTVYIEGKNIFDESRKFTIDKSARRQNPAVAIIPAIDFSFDREKLDIPLGGLELYEEKSMYDTCFFRDYDNKLYIKEIDQLNLINFTIRVYTDTRAKQLNLWHYMKLAFRVGATQGEYIDMDFSIPEDLMIQLAIDTGFKVDIENKKIVNVVDFLNYLNKNSLIPFLYKLRCENGRDEFFIRKPGEYVHIAIPDNLSPEDGDRVGHTYENFPIEMNLALRFPTPQSYVYMSKNPQKIIEGVKMQDSGDVVGLYSLKFIDIPKQNDKKWGLYIQSEYIEDKPSKIITMDFNDLFDVTVREVMEYTKKQFLSPYIFIDIKIYTPEGDILKSKIDWDTLIVETLESEKEYQKVAIAVYIDNTYLNETIVTMNNSSNSRLNTSKTQ